MNGEESTREIASVIVAHAARDGMGDTPPWDDVMAGLRRLRDDPTGAEHLRRAVDALNNKDAVGIIASWCNRLFEIDEAAGRDAGRMGAVFVQPLQMGFIGFTVSAALTLAVGTLGALPGAVLLAFCGAAASTATYTRWRFSRVEDTRKRDADRTKRLLAVLKG